MSELLYLCYVNMKYKYVVMNGVKCQNMLKVITFKQQNNRHFKLMDVIFFISMKYPFLLTSSMRSSSSSDSIITFPLRLLLVYYAGHVHPGLENILNPVVS